ncbi:MAG: hypothetical protein OXF52_06150 [Candidatus Dadabacteria bacterium]|nr:hypothetical protein [Candidatus Dadabacteria bacterium]
MAINFMAIATGVVTAIAGAFVALYVYHHQSKRKIKENTIDLLSKHETDPTLYDVQRYMNKTLRENGADLSKIEDVGELRFFSSKILNYYEGIAYRVREGLVDKGTIKKQYKDMIIRDIDSLLKGEESGGIKPPKEPLFSEDQAEKWLPDLMEFYRELKKEEEKPDPE